MLVHKWFLTKVQNAIGDWEEIVVISDRHEGILHGVKEVYPNVEHNYFMRHLLNNIRKNFSELLVDVNWKFINTTKAYRVEEWESYMRMLDHENNNILGFLKETGHKN